MYYSVYYLRPNDVIVGAAGIDFATIAAAYQHAAEQLEHHHGVEVWKDGQQVFVVRREEPAVEASRPRAA